jgi:transposase-like protein
MDEIEPQPLPLVSPDPKAQKRAEVILQVQGRKLNATEGAAALGVSRKTYYKWENRALQGMIQALQDEEAGRPLAPVDTEKEALKAKLSQVEQELAMAKQSQYVREVLQRYEQYRTEAEQKKAGAKKKRS